MINIEAFEKDNMKVLGLMVRYKRLSLGYSLRDLGEITNISHTLISNFERGIMIPNIKTIKDIFKVLELDFYDDPEISVKFTMYFNKIFKHILYYEYEEAGILIKEIEKDSEIYENSKEVINYVIIRCLFYILTNTYVDEKDKILNQYIVVLDFFSENQKQLFYFIKGMDYLNQEFYKEARINYEKALNLGDNGLNLLINEHYVIALSKSNKFVDAGRIAEECIALYEQQTNYVRAMRLRTRIAHDYIRIHKFDDAIKLYKYVYDFAVKYNIKDLENRCNTKLAQICIFHKDFVKAEKYLDEVTLPNFYMYFYLRFDILAHKNDELGLLELYENLIKEDWVKISLKTMNFYELILMRNNDKYMDKKRYEKILKEQIKIAFKSDDAEMIEVSSKMLANFYKKERAYKKAFDIHDSLLHYLKYGVE